MARLAGIDPAAFGSGSQEKATRFSPIPGVEGVFDFSTVSQKWAFLRKFGPFVARVFVGLLRICMYLILQQRHEGRSNLPQDNGFRILIPLAQAHGGIVAFSSRKPSFLVLQIYAEFGDFKHFWRQSVQSK